MSSRPDREHRDVALPERLEERRIGREILAVGDQDDRLLARQARRIRREECRGALERDAKRRPGIDPEPAARVVERGAQHLRVGGERIAAGSRSREQGQPDTAADQLLGDLLDRLLRDAQPIGRDVRHGHALRDVQRDHRVDGRGRAAAGRLADLRPDQRGDGREQGDREERELCDLSRGARRDQRRARATEGRGRAAAPDQSQSGEREDRERSEEQWSELGVREGDLHGTLRKSVAARAISPKSSAAPRIRKARWASW